MSDLLGIGASGVTAYRSALSVIGDNIVNAETPGYARRQVVLKESGLSSGAGTLNVNLIGVGGVDPAGVRRAWDDFKAADSRLSASVAGRTETRLRWLNTTEGALDDGATGVGQSVTGVFTAADTLATDPGNTGSRRAFLVAIDGAADAFRTTADMLSRTSDGIAAEAQTTVDATNADLQSLARLNAALRRAGSGSAGFSQLSDERDRLLDNLSGRIDIHVSMANDGSVSVKLARTGLKLVDNKALEPAAVSLVRSDDGRLSVQIVSDGDIHPVVPASGALAGLVETAGIVANRRAQLDSLAANFATRLNDWSAAGTDANGAAGTPLLAFDPDDAAASLAPAIADRDPATVAAATTIDNGDGTTTVTANGNLLTLSALRGTDGTEKVWATLVSGQSQILASAKSEDTTAAARKDASFAARDDVAGVDLDQEAGELLRFQQAYNGSAKIIQVARETLQTILDIL